MLIIFNNIKTVIILFLLTVFVFGYGIVRDNNINKENQKIKESLPSITCWGDSLTAGAGGEGVTYSKTLSKLTGLTVYNMGVGGEKTNTISCRQGARQMMVNNITIPSTTTQIEVGKYQNFFDNYGSVIEPLRQGDAGINPCYINGIKGTLSSTQSSITSKDVVYYFKRSQGGQEVKITEPTPIITKGSLERKNDITIIFIGQNGGYSNIDDLVSQQRKMINYTGHDRYIILGLTSGSASERAELEARMKQEYGDKYINLREYLCNSGLKDSGITPTATDEAQLKQGLVPDSLRSDAVHGNKYFYELIGKQLYNMIIELNYLSDEQKEYLGLS